MQLIDVGGPRRMEEHDFLVHLVEGEPVTVRAIKFKIVDGVYRFIVQNEAGGDLFKCTFRVEDVRSVEML